MLYCPGCLEEYEDSAKTCSECKAELLTEEALSKRPEFRRLREDEDVRNFVVIGPAEDPFEADAFTAAISEAGIPVFAHMRRTSAVDALTESVQRSWWEILVPADQREKAVEVMARRHAEIEESESDAERAAEEESSEEEAAEAEAASKKKA